MGWTFWIDRGGTFTDIVAVNPAGELIARKFLSQAPDRYDDAAVFGMRAILGVDRDAPFPADDIDVIKMGTTVATNALLERKGAPTVLAITRGFADALTIGTQHRPKLFALDIVLPPPLHTAVIEIDERIGVDGTVLRDLDAGAAERAMAAQFAAGYRAIAIVLMHGDRFPDHERRLAAIARRVGFTQVSTSHDTNPLIKLIPRGDTTVCDAYLSPVLRGYVDGISAQVGAARLLFMQSNGGLADAGRVQGKDAVLSGPAGGVVGFVETARATGYENVIGFDMGGTSTDVAHYGGLYERTLDTVIDGVRLRAPMLKINTVAAGGGSICTFDGIRLRVGPESAGADPGPACYRRGGPLTITDCNLLIGKIRPDTFPHAFGPKADQPLDEAAAASRAQALVDATVAATGKHFDVAELAEGFIAIAVDNMARAIRKISVEAGHDARDYALACFGGAGGQHACLVADALGIQTVIIHPLAGVLSAYGIGIARQRAVKERTLRLPLDARHHAEIAAALDTLADAVRAALAPPQGSPPRADINKTIHIRYPGSDTVLPVAFGPQAEMADAFADAHRRRFGFVQANEPLICEIAEVEAISAAEAAPTVAMQSTARSGPRARARMFSSGRWHDVACLTRVDLPPGQDLEGPAIVIDDLATTVIEPGWTCRVRPGGELVLERNRAARAAAVSVARDPVYVELFNNLFMSIAEQMGAVLQNTARSVNIKERLDFSCAVFDRHGNLIANAPHMPVHLGSMGDSVRAVIARHDRRMRGGDSYVINAPYNGGTHLPDITVVTPVFLETNSRPAYFVASRGHHADIGGITPGSMPPLSTRVDQEGVTFDGELLIRDGTFQTEAILKKLCGAAYPARNPHTNLADLQAQAAANAMGEAELRRISARYGADVVAAYMGHVQDFGAEAVRQSLAKLTSGSFECAMDNGATIKVRIDIDRPSQTAIVDFTGTSAQRDDNFNAPLSVCRAAVLYAFRCLVDMDIPLNDGCLRPINLVVPERSMLDPRPPAAVVAGNVETSQIICDVLFGAMNVLAASQGTMNNFTFGDARHQYYETVCGGAGAGPGHNGANAVQTHMTNSRLTDPEIIEARFPVVLERFSIRRGSGGSGRFRGGDGVEREFRFLQPMTAAILSGRRRHAPHGLAGGGAARPGETELNRADGQSEHLAATAQIEINPGDRVVIRTPGGGGYGRLS